MVNVPTLRSQSTIGYADASRTVTTTSDLNALGDNLLKSQTICHGQVRTATYTYDGLNRVTSRNYSDSTPAVSYTYDAVVNGRGRLTAVSSSVSMSSYAAYDARDGHVLNGPAIKGLAEAEE